MKRLGSGPSDYILSKIKRITLSAKRPATTVVPKRQFHSSALPISVTLSLLLVGLTLAPSMRGPLTRGGSVIAFDETINTFASSDCATPKSEWDLGQTACAVATGAVSSRRIAWVAPDGAIAQVSS